MSKNQAKQIINTNKKAIILLSGGLDSIVSLDIALNKLKDLDVVLALNFNYGQKAYLEENKASADIAKYYKIKLVTIEIPFLSAISDNALTDIENNNFDDFKSLWIPNRNGLFLNIAGSYCDKFGIDYIIFGANKKEAENFSDNSEEFIKRANEFFEYSTLKHPKVLAPCSNMNKVDIINYAIDNSLPLDLVKSCYDSKDHSTKKHCGKCTSCKLLYEAIKQSHKPELLNKFFS